MPDLETILRAAPIGLLMLIGTYLARRRRLSGFARARQEFPEVARTLGLLHRPPADARSIGTLRGEHGGYEVFVDPDDRPRIVVYLRSAPELVLRNYEHEKRTPPGMETLPRLTPGLDTFFRDRFAAPEVSGRLLEQAAELERTLAPFTGRHRGALQHLSVTPERIECTLDFGRPPHLTVDAVLELVPAAVRLARLLDGSDALAEAKRAEGPG